MKLYISEKLIEENVKKISIAKRMVGENDIIINANGYYEILGDEIIRIEQEEIDDNSAT